MAHSKFRPNNRFGSGKYGAGRTLNENGYLRLNAGKNRNKYEHRVVMAEMCKEFCYYPLIEDGLPSGMTVEHVDHKKIHNCRQNLLLLDIEIHNWISWKSWLNKDKMGPPPSRSYLPGPDDINYEEGAVRYTQAERDDVPF